MIIKMFNSSINTKYSFFKCDLEIHIQVIPYSIKVRMCLLPKCKYYITRHIIWTLFTFSFKHNFLSIFHSFFNFNFKYFCIRNNTCSTTSWTILGSFSTWSTTIFTCSLHLKYHSRPHTHFLHTYTPSPTMLTLSYFTIFRPSSTTCWTYYIPLYRHFFCCTII